ncbi:ABC transporter ATP-binding protein [Salipaludibacillus sp. CUR1]|uniref:ABC transporter ATP-binding protein n=1 Tax=Salipaludibacillus sp. CUR1 TaxID=2820003 RepID=UPI001E3F8E6C|nr:ABC transporter ATP-binding protein [Salipaludibacillus sp. CUR1]MCE7792190.1 ABC transporter ATP-binding protein [Salipaludibacillus sp. CUR1]
MFEVKDLSCRRSGKDILLNASATFYEGEVTAIIGPNGAGKTTLLKCLAGFLKPSRGEVMLNGKPLSSISLKDRARKISFVPQATSPAFPLTVFEMVMHGRRPYVNWGIGKKDRRIVTNLLKKLHIEELSGCFLDEISGGQKQKAAIARALAQQTEVILLDEPTSALDIRYEYEVLQIGRDLAKKEGRTVIMVLHDLELAARFSDRIVLVDNGRIFCRGKPDEVMTQEHLRKVYEVNTVIEQGTAGMKVTVTSPVKRGGEINETVIDNS